MKQTKLFLLNDHMCRNDDCIISNALRYMSGKLQSTTTLRKQIKDEIIWVYILGPQTDTS